MNIARDMKSSHVIGIMLFGRVCPLTKCVMSGVKYTMNAIAIQIV